VIELAAIEAARKRIEGAAVRTPLVRLHVEDAPAEIYLKLENLQPINSFKIRGATNAIMIASPGERASRLGRPARTGPRSAVPPIEPQAFLRVLDQQVADRQATLLGPGGQPFGQHGRHDHRTADAIVTLPRLVRRLIAPLRQAPSPQLSRAPPHRE
jgi:hypothetical protein